jgi:hypothetical protein
MANIFHVASMQLNMDEQKEVPKKKSSCWRFFWFLGKVIGLVLLVKFIKNRMGKKEEVCEGGESQLKNPDEEKENEIM